MRCVVIVGAGLFSIVGFVGAASAADLPVATYSKAPTVVDPAYNWTGFYLGAEGGYDWGRSQHDWADPASPAFIGQPLTNGIKADGGLIGGTFGYNYQFGNNIVIGFENDISWTNSKGTASYIAPFTGGDTAQTSQSWLYTARGRLGYAWDRWLVFGTGGVAFTDEGIQLCNLAFGCGSQSKTVAGWTAGGGVEYAFTDNWSAKLEYLHNDFGSQSFARTLDSGGGLFHSQNVTLTNDIVRAGVNYKFGSDSSVAVRYPNAPVTVDPVWTGLYLGAEAGVGWSRDQRTYDPSGGFTNEQLAGGVAGGLIGYNWQLPGNQFLLGVEGSFDWADINGSAPCPNPAFACGEKPNQLYSGTGRIGYLWGNALLYGKGGYAWTETDYHSTFLTNPGPFDGGGNINRDGWVVGGGVEYMFAPRWSAKVEYDYYDFGSKTAATDSGGAAHALTDKDSKLTAQTLKVGVDYHFGWSGPAGAID
jgi:outer membrane immunogenic protein